MEGHAVSIQVREDSDAHSHASEGGAGGVPASAAVPEDVDGLATATSKAAWAVAFRAVHCPALVWHWRW